MILWSLAEQLDRIQIIRQQPECSPVGRCKGWQDLFLSI